MPLIVDVLTLTLYRDGLANLNGEATRALPAGAASLLLLPPNRASPHWVLVPATGGLLGDIQLVGRSDRGNLRFRAPSLAVALFAAVPREQPALRLVLEPAPALGWCLVAQNRCTNN
ncbi:hypothetical protein BEN47_05080 [Hymenobacter lapidarius]|uniref:Uncharacterized protein n=1 Tax=Hymenobacter lapidarius TaxID=1908237 RepID=A0A1G1STQ9_9BACT|nr:hypothetical protein [Hymenobacter lapidarius]OGX81995.1 hypothetical protein BEN47_05080 [Hymenobacter lapidarius]